MWIAIILIAALYALHAGAKPGIANPTAASGQSFTAINETQTVMRQLADGRVFSGAVAVQKAGSIVYSEGFGYALQELGVPMKAEYIFPLGSQAKFFTSVAIHQLAKQGHLNISDPVAIHLDPADFPALRNKTWCPLVHGRESEGCQNVTVLQLLTMTSGILPADMGLCGDLPASKDWTPADWYYPYRVTALNLTYGDATGATGDFLNGAGRLVDVVNRIRVLEMPLLSAPGESWCYDDANYNILGYLVEKFSNTSIREYIQSHILTPANLTDTFYWNGAPGVQPGGLRMRMLPVPAYTADFTGTAPPYAFVTSNRFRGWTGDLGFQVGASGAMFSTVTDSLEWYMTFLLRPKVLGLTKADVSAMITPQLDHLPRLPNGTKGPGYNDAAQFAQGMSTHGSSDAGHGIEFTGGQWGFMVNTRVWLNDKDWSQSDGVVVFMNSTPHLPASDNCTVASPTDNSVITVATEVCGHVADESTPLTDYVVSELARIWNITGVYPQATAQLG